jgi:hypothetical protein
LRVQIESAVKSWNASRFVHILQVNGRHASSGLDALTLKLSSNFVNLAKNLHMWIRPVSPLCLLLVCFLIFRCDREEGGPHLDGPGPFEVTVEVINFSSVILHWTSSPGADHYDVFLETDLIAGDVKSDSVKLENLIGEISYSGYVVAIDGKGQQQITAYSFEIKIPQPDDREYILPKRVFFRHMYAGDYIDSVWIDYTYLSDGRLDMISRRTKKTVYFQHSNVESSDRFEFAYLGRSMVINNYNNNTDELLATIRLSFNNESYILPEYYAISRFSGDQNSFDSAVFTYAKNFYIDSVTYYYPSEVRVSHFYSNSSNSFYNGQLEFTDTPAPFQQIIGFSDFFGPSPEFAYENPLIYPLRMFSSPPTLLARRYSGDLPYKYTFENEKLSSIEYTSYGWTGNLDDMDIFFEY